MNTETLKTIGQYDEFEAQINEVADICNFIPDTTTKDGYEKSKRVSLDVGKVLTALEKSRKDKKADSIRIGKAIDSEAKSIKAKLEAIQLPHKEAYKTLDNERKQREQDRKDALELRVAELRDLPELLRESDSSSIAGALDQVNAEECLDFFEYTADALKARNASRAALADMHTKALQAEKDAAELAELRRAQAEKAIKDREQAAADNARKEAEQKAAAEAAKIEADRLAAVYAQEAAEERERQAEGKRRAAELKAKQDTIEAAELAEKQRAAAVQAEKDRQEAEKQREAAELAKREANKRHIGAVRKAAKEALMNIDGMTEEIAKQTVLAISNGLIPAVKINY